MIKMSYKVTSMLASMAGGMLASAIFKRLWKLAAGEDQAPEATDAAKGWPEILAAAALQGAIFAVVRALVERLAAEGTRSLTGTWPGEDSSTKKRETAKS
jgi:hypothetical protein